MEQKLFNFNNEFMICTKLPFNEAVAILNEIEYLYEKVNGPKVIWDESLLNGVAENRNYILALYGKTDEPKKKQFKVGNFTHHKLRYDLALDVLNQIECDYEKIIGFKDSWNRDFSNRVQVNRMAGLIHSCKDMDDVRLPYAD